MRNTLHRLRIAGLLLASLPGVSQAAEKTGLPQFDPHTFASQLFWLAVMFIIVYLFMRTVAIPRIAAILDERNGRITGDLDEAERMRTAAQQATATYEAALADAHAKARQLLAETHEKNVATLAEQTRAAGAAFDQKVGDSLKRIAAARAAALDGVREVAAGLASEITTKLTGRAPAPESVARAVDTAAGAEAA